MLFRISLLIIVVEAVIYLLCGYLADSPFSWQLMARYSARVSFGIFFVLQIVIAKKGLKCVWQEDFSQWHFLLFAFALNHLIHFFFIAAHFAKIDWEFNPMRQGFGLLVYLLLPIVLFLSSRANKSFKLFYWLSQILLLLANISFTVSYAGRYFAQDMAYAYPISYLSLLIMSSVALLGFFRNLYLDFRS